MEQLQINLQLSSSSQIQKHPQENQQQLIKKLNHIYAILISNPPPHQPLVHLKEYITLYIENKKHNQQAFLELCQHQIVSLFFGFKDQSKSYTNRPICLQTLEIFNLLLANTNKPDQLGYILSQRALHQGLFVNALSVKDHQFIQYYAQILKSITMKLSQKQNRSLIRVFYNSKYPSFPLMINCTFMATDMKEQLVRVTARQCVLVLIMLLKQKGMTGYLSQIPMLLFYARLIQQQSFKIQLQQGDIGYLGDLIWAVKQNLVALFSICNGISSQLIVYNLKNPVLIIKIIRQIVKILKSHAIQIEDQQYKKQHYQWINKIQICFYSILSRFNFRRYIKSQFLSLYFKTLSGQRKIQLFPQNLTPLYIIKKISQSCGKTFTQLQKQLYKNGSRIKDQSCSVLSSQLVLYCQHLEQHFHSNKQFLKQKQNFGKGDLKHFKRKQSFNLITTVMRKVSQEYLYTSLLENISKIIAFKAQHGKYIKNSQMHKVIQNPSSAIFITQFCYFSVAEYEKSKSIYFQQQYGQTTLNELRSIWNLDKSFLNEILKMLLQQQQIINQKFKIQKQQGNSIKSEKNETFFSGTGFYLSQFANYLSENIHLKTQGAGSIYLSALILLQKVCKLLKVKLNSVSTHQIIKKVGNIHTQIQGFLFQNGFAQVTNYILFFDIEKYQQNKQVSILYRKLMQYQLLQKIIQDNKVQNYSLKEVFAQNLKNEPLNEEKYLFKVQCYGRKDCQLVIQINSTPSIFINVFLHGKNIFSIDLLNTQCKVRQNQIHPKIIHCGENSEPIKFQTNQESQKFLEIIKKFKFTIQEAVTMAVVKYLEVSSQKLKQLDYQSHKKQKTSSKIFQSYISTPR